MPGLLEKINSELSKYYSQKADTSSNNSQAVGWKNEAAQHVRFAQLIKVISDKEGSINDFGCGLGDLSKYLVNQGFPKVKYAGYDMFSSMVDRARDLYGESDSRKFYHITGPDEMKAADYTVASGVLNIRFGISDDRWLEFIKEMITLFNSKSKKGFAFNALTSYSDKEYMRPELYYTDPTVLFDFCKRNFSKDVALLHDYGEYDFTIIVRK